MSRRGAKAEGEGLLVDLAILRPGDVLLEQGMPKVAKRTAQGPNAYGHASLALGRLVRIHALGSGQVTSVQAFEIEKWRRRSDGTEIIAQGVSAPTTIRRPTFNVRTIDLVSEAQWEAGFPYADAKKLSNLNGLSPTDSLLLSSPIGKALLHRYNSGSVPPSAEGRSCGELVARVLSFESPEVTPNLLAVESRLYDIERCLYEEEEFEFVGIPKQVEEINRLISEYDLGPSRRAWQTFLEEAKRREAQYGEASSKVDVNFIEILENELIAAITDNSNILIKIEKMEAEIFEDRYDPLR